MKIRLLILPPGQTHSWRPLSSLALNRIRVVPLIACLFVLSLSLSPVLADSETTSKNYSPSPSSIGDGFPKSLDNPSSNPLLPCSGTKCRRRRKSSKTNKQPSLPISDKISHNASTSVMTSTNLSTSLDLKSLAKSVVRQRKQCKSGKKAGFSCRRLGWISWMISQLDRPNTPLHPWVELVKNPELSENVSLSENELMPENWPEEKLFSLLQRFGDPMDRLLFHKYKEFVKSRELRVRVPHLFEVKLTPRTHAIAGTGRSTPRIFWDPGFNLKLKLPFFKDELSKCFPIFCKIITFFLVKGERAHLIFCKVIINSSSVSF